MKAKTNDQIRGILAGCKFRDWDIVMRFDSIIYIHGKPVEDKPYLQIQFDAPDSFTGVVERQYCRKWKLSRYMTKSEIVRTVYKAIEAAVVHEMQEDFKFDGEPIFRPHFDVNILHEISSAGAIDKRD